jgi:hypothetical protein
MAKLTSGDRGDTIEIIFDLDDKNVTNGARGDTIDIMFDKVNPNGSRWFQVNQNVILWCQRGENWEHVCPSQLKCDQLVPGWTQFVIFDQVNQNVTSLCQGRTKLG